MNDTEAAFAELEKWASHGLRSWEFGNGFGYCVQPFLTLSEYDHDDDEVLSPVKKLGETFDSNPDGPKTFAEVIRAALKRWDEKYGNAENRSEITS